MVEVDDYCRKLNIQFQWQSYHNCGLCLDFDKKAKKEPSPLLEQFLCHVAKTGQTMVPWSQFKNYFLFKLEKVMDDFRASAPEQRASANPNVESVPFEDMKERILKIVKGYNG
ncbi:Serine/threonine-protein phosphatase 4 regulatory subunit 2-B, partial [Ilyodon furcidens]